MFRVLRLDFKLKSFKSMVTVKGHTEGNRHVRFVSYKHSCSGISLMYKSMGTLLNEAVEKKPDKTAYICSHQKQRITFEKLKSEMENFAVGVLELGVNKGDRVGVWTPNCVEWFVISYALASTGIISVYLNPSYQALELAHCLNAVDVKMLILTESFKSQNLLQVLDETIPELKSSQVGKLNSKKVPTLKNVVCISDQVFPGVLPYKSVFEKCSESSWKKLKELQSSIDPDEPSNIQFTSGTTGSPKGAILTHFNIVNNSYFISRRQKLEEKDHIGCFMGPLFHALGSVIAVLTFLHNACTMVIPDIGFNSVSSAKSIVDEKVTVTVGTPTMYIDILKVFSENKIRPTTVEIAVSGGAYCSSTLFNDMISILGVKRVASVYGLTEAGPIVFMSEANDTKEQTLTTVGSLMNLTEAKVVDENLKIVPWDTPGELWVRGYNVMKGYWNAEQKTKEMITPDRWLRTGDKFLLSENGYGRIVGRIKDMIIRGGENIYPSEIEEFLITHPDILEVEVVGVPDDRLGEQVCACIRLKKGAELTEGKVKEYCKGKIASFKIPAYVLFLNEFPKTPSGKVQKYLLRNIAMEKFQLQK